MRQWRDAIASLSRTATSTAGLAKRGSTTRALPAALAGCASLNLVGRVGVEPTTSRLSGVRSNHLSYRPVPAAPSVAAKLRLMARSAALAELTDVRHSYRYVVSSVPVDEGT
jgi:hypothetical protein